MSKTQTDVFMHTTTDFSQCTPGEKRLFVEELVSSGRLTKEIMINCLKDINLKGRSKIISDLPSTHGWASAYRRNINAPDNQKKAINAFCAAVSPELLIKHIVLKEAWELTRILDVDPPYGKNRTGVYPRFKVNIALEHNVIK